MKSRTVPVKNIARLSDAAEMLLRRAPGMPGMGLVHGETGTGKTTALTWLRNRPNVNAIYVRALALWTPSAMLGALLRETGRPPRNACAAMMDDLIEALALSGRPVFIDEADYLVESKKMTEALRDLHDMTATPVVLIGMAGIDQRLANRKQLTGRVLADVHFERLDAEDAALVAHELCELRVADDLLAAALQATGGFVRNLVVALNRIEAFGRPRGMDTVTLADWGKRDFITGRAPGGEPRASLHGVKPQEPRKPKDEEGPDDEGGVPA